MGVMRGTRSYQTPPQLCYKWSRDLKIKWMVLRSDVAGNSWDTNADMEEPRTLPKHGKNVDINQVKIIECHAKISSADVAEGSVRWP